MLINRFYTIAFWLPMLIPIATALGVVVFGMPNFLPLSTVVVAIMTSGIFGSIPYSLFAVWASRWIRGRTEAEIRRLALRAPILMLLLFVPIAFLIGAPSGHQSTTDS